MKRKLKKNLKRKGKRLKKRKTSILKTKKHKARSAKKDEIYREMTIFQAMRKKPEIIEKLLAMGMGCGGCQFASMETIEQGCVVHGLDVEKVLKELND